MVDRGERVRRHAFCRLRAATVVAGRGDMGSAVAFVLIFGAACDSTGAFIVGASYKCTLKRESVNYDVAAT